MVDLDNLYGNLQEKPEIRFDPFQSWIEDGIIVGYQVTIVPNRSNRPREQRPIFVNTPEEDMMLQKDNILLKVSRGEIPGYLVSTDNQYIQNPFQEKFELTEKTFEQYKAICILNKYSIFSRVAKMDNGIMLVAYPTKIIRYPREDYHAVAATLKSLKYAISGILQDNNPEKMKLVSFFNIGANSGSSLVQLHAQTYIYNTHKKMLGNVEYNFLRAYNYNKSKDRCLACLHFSPGETDDDIISDALNPELLIWEDENAKLKVAFAPIRTGQLRIIPKAHKPNLSEFSLEEINSIAHAIAIADEVMYNYINSRNLRVGMNDRSIAFRQQLQNDYHCIIDLFPVYAGFGGAELIVPIGINSVFPEWLGESLSVKED